MAISITELTEKETRDKSERITKQMFGMNPENNVYIFFRDDYFYPINLKNDEEALACVKCNTGTTKVENAFTREIIFEKK